MSLPPAFETVSIELGEAPGEEGIGWLFFDRPDKRNAMSPTLNAEMIAALDWLEAADDVRRGRAHRRGDAWSAGMDLQEYFREVDAGRRRTSRSAPAATPPSGSGAD